jgi:hypothetical protein
VLRAELVRNGLFEFFHFPDTVPHALEPVAVNDLAPDHFRKSIDFLLVEKLETGHYSIASL